MALEFDSLFERVCSSTGGYAATVMLGFGRRPRFWSLFL